MKKRRFRYFAVMLGDCVEIRRGFTPPSKIVSKLHLPKRDHSGMYHPETNEPIGTLLVQTYYSGCKTIGICSYLKFTRTIGTPFKTKGCRELTRTEKDVVMQVAISLL